MKPKNLKPKAAPPPVKTTAQRADEGLEQVIALEHELSILQEDMMPKVRTLINEAGENTKQFITNIAREHFGMREDRIMKKIFDFLNQAPLWETRFVPGIQTQREEIEHLYKQGWRYVGSVMDAKTKTAGTVYHRPKMVKTAEEFDKLYRKMTLEANNPPAQMKKREDYVAAVGKKVDEKVKHKAEIREKRVLANKAKKSED